ncbi:MFS transporter [Streptomyces sp. MMG1121]|uniref:MFS transporter n=1 Tax=Streptomyces sp. MMG1121 TaxID=1415544 RepID=UPI0006AEE960|nr:MFS transporter [Streptomyces sp. MMG1121]KOV64043.1 MFS transporter [Streptomyces sp. MMG1121]
MSDVAQEAAQNAETVTVGATFRQAPLAAKALLVGVFVNRLGGFLNIFLVLFLASRGYSTSQAALALGVYGGGAIAGVFFGGALATRLGARNASVISMASASVLMAAIIHLPSYGLILVAVALVGLVGQLYRPASAALLSDLTPAHRQVMIFAMYRFGINLGATVAPLLGFALYNLGGQSYTLVFWCEALIALVYAAIAWRALPPRSAQPASATAEAGAESGDEAPGRGGYAAMMRDRRYVVYLLAMLLYAMVYAQYLSTLPLDVKARDVAVLWYTLAVSLNGFIVICFELLLTKVTQAWPHRLTISLTLVLLSGGVALYGLPLGPAVILLGTLIWSIGEIIGGPAAMAYPGIAGPPGRKAHYIGGFQFIWSLGTAVGPVVGGWLFVQLGHQVWPVFAAGSLVATILVLAAVPGRTPAAE